MSFKLMKWWDYFIASYEDLETPKLFHSTAWLVEKSGQSLKNGSVHLTFTLALKEKSLKITATDGTISKAFYL